MNFRQKSIIQKVLSNIPYGEKVNYLLQRYVTRKLPVSKDVFLIKVRSAFQHYENFVKFNQVKEKTNRYYEFGAGWDLITPITMGILGFQVICTDIRRLVFSNLILDTLNKFQAYKSEIPFIFSLDTKNARNTDILQFIKDTIQVSYFAPVDARKTDYQSEYFDFISSSATFEHIPSKDLELILEESHRLLQPGGILSLVIDYQDHYAYFDKKVSVYNFLQYDEKEWKSLNPDLHYQNRLRHPDYLRLIKKTNFEIVFDNPTPPTEHDLETIKSMKLDKNFTNYSLLELGIKGSTIVLRKLKD